MSKTGLTFSSLDPWPDAVDGAALLSSLAATFQRFLVLPEGGPELLALWVPHTHAFDSSFVTAYLNINSPTKGCGKSTAFEILQELVPRPLLLNNASGAGIFRAVEKYRPTLLLDECETFVKLHDDIRGILNAGNRRNTSFVLRCVGDDYAPTCFSTWCPKAFSLIGRLPETLEDRSIVLTMHRKAPHEKAERFNPFKHSDALRELCRKAARWAADHLEELREAEPDIPPELINRTWDKWAPLIAIGDAAGGQWPQKARQLALHFSGLTSQAEDSAAVMLLADLRGIFNSEERLFGAEIVERLGELKHRPWPEWCRGRRISQKQLANLLAPFGIRPKSIWIGKENARGYARQDFEEAFIRYLPPVEVSEVSKSRGSNDLCRFDDPSGSVRSDASTVRPDTSKNGLSHCKQGTFTVLTVRRGEGQLLGPISSEVF